jgi:hypothetical protein
MHYANHPNRRPSPASAACGFDPRLCGFGARETLMSGGHYWSFGLKTAENAVFAADWRRWHADCV